MSGRSRRTLDGARGRVHDVRRRFAARVARVERGLDPNSHNAALTFDDGPDEVFTPKLLEVLDEIDVRATFFCVGEQVRRHPELVARIVAEGHTIGSHSATHPDPKVSSTRRLLDEYRSGRDAVTSATGRPCRLFRPPYGRVTGRVALAVRLAGLRPWLWTVDPRDWEPGIEPEEINRRVGSLRGGDVVLLHDGMFDPVDDSARDRSATLAALPAIVNEARAAGLAFVPLPA